MKKYLAKFRVKENHVDEIKEAYGKEVEIEDLTEEMKIGLSLYPELKYTYKERVCRENDFEYIREIK